MHMVEGLYWVVFAAKKELISTLGNCSFLIKHITQYSVHYSNDVMQMMQIADPEGCIFRRRRRLKRRVYQSHGPNFAWHIDGSVIYHFYI
jgi:hypothetical protein